VRPPAIPPRSTLRRRAALALALTLSLAPGLTLARQPTPSPADPDPRDRLQRDFVQAWNARDLATAEARLREWIALRPLEYTPVYNLASLLSVRGDAEPAAEALERAVLLGFADRRTLESDPHLALARRTERCRALLADWPATLDRVLDARLARIRESLPKYTIERDPDLRIAFASGFHPDSLAAARLEITRVARWWQEQVLPEGRPAVARDGDSPDPWVLVLLPTQPDFQAWAQKRFNRPGAISTVAGVYDHDRLELVAGDLGPTFRHEFLHVLHWRDMTRTGRLHPVWIQEGLCSLVEDVRADTHDDQPRLTPLPSWRTNTIKRRAANTRVSIGALLKLPREKFTSSTPLANYALARAIFLYLSDKGRLRAWYAAYDASFDADPSGLKALEVALDAPIAQIEKDFRAYLKALPEVPDDSRPGRARLPLDTGLPAGDGIAVEAVGPRCRDILPGDVITAVNGTPVRELQELARVLGDLNPGTPVDVTFRRHKKILTTRLTLIPRE